MDFEQLKQKLREIRNIGFITTHRAHDTGIGKTLEDLLDIPENNISLPDIGEVELKTKRSGSGSMLTIATKAPSPRGANKRLFENYGYKDNGGIYNLHSTASGLKPNPQGFRVTIVGARIILENPKEIEAYWPTSIFDNVLKSKSGKILIVFARTRGEERTSTEEFHYNEAYLLSGLNEKKFQDTVKTGKLKIDTRIGSFRSGNKKGKYHDHGTGFRIAKRDFLSLFNNYEKVL